VTRATAAARADRLEALADEIRGHGGCGFEPCETCTHQVPGEGSARAEVMLLGEAPGRQEDLHGRPFVGAAGRLLDELLETAGLSRDEVFITNVLKARPPGNRDPRADEIEHGRPWLDEQLDLIRPKLVVPLGRHALERFLPGSRITDVHGSLQRAGGWSYYPLYHPAAALRGRALRATLFDDASGLPRALTAVTRRPRSGVQTA
jgi:uracil-DNA glycosylase family 4